MLNILAIDCQDSNVLEIILLIKNIIEIIRIVAPIILIIFVMIDCFKNVTDKEGYNTKIIKRIIFKFLAAAFIFFVMPITNIVLSILGESPIETWSCYKNANETYIEKRKKAENAINNSTTTNKNFTKYLAQELKKRHDLDLSKKNQNTNQNENNTSSEETTHKGETVSFTNFPYYNQALESTYGKYPYCGNGFTLHTDGCGVFAFSVLASGIVNVNYTPDVVAKFICQNISGQGNGNGTYPSVFNGQVLASHFGLKTEKIKVSQKEPLRKYLEKNLKQDSGLIINVPNHYLTVVKSNTGKYGVLDSGSRELTQEYSYDEFYAFINNYKGRGTYTSAWLVRKKKIGEV